MTTTTISDGSEPLDRRPAGAPIYSAPGDGLSGSSPSDARAWLAAIVENSDDAILSKNLDGVITSWNAGATRLFGYLPQEAVGRHITIIIPEDRRSEEDTIIGRIRRGERIHHFETVRKRKDGSLVDVSLTISPVRNDAGKILGASKIARDISQARRDAERLSLVLREMNHRVKNLFALMTSLIALSSHRAASVGEFVEDLMGRVASLSRAHSLTLPDLAAEAPNSGGSTIRSLVEAVLTPFRIDAGSRVSVNGDDLPIGARALPSLALLVHEFATNAAKYGALATAAGHVIVDVRVADDLVTVTWRETGAPDTPATKPLAEGFGARLERATARALSGTVEREWRDDGLVIRLVFPVDHLNA